MVNINNIKFTILTIFKYIRQCFPCGSAGKESTCNAGDLGSIPGLGRSPGEANGNLLQYPCLENLMDRGAWWAAVHGVTESWAWLSANTLRNHHTVLHSDCANLHSYQQCRRCGFNCWVGKIPWRRKWQPTPVFLPGKSHGQRSLAGYRPWGQKESDMTWQLNNIMCNSILKSERKMWCPQKVFGILCFS